MFNKVYSELITLKIRRPYLATTYKINNINHYPVKDKVNYKLKICLLKIINKIRTKK